MQIFLNVVRLHCHKSVRYPKKFNLVHQTVFPHERVGSGDETIHLLTSPKFYTDSLMIIVFRLSAFYSPFKTHSYCILDQFNFYITLIYEALQAV